MSIWKEERKVKRPLLYLTGGLVLGETTALFQMARQGSACVLTVAAALIWLHISAAAESRRNNGRGKHRPAAQHTQKRELVTGNNGKRLSEKALRWQAAMRTSVFVFLLGFLCGLWRMEAEKQNFLKEDAVAARFANTERGTDGGAVVTGVIVGIEERDQGARLLLGDCQFHDDSSPGPGGTAGYGSDFGCGAVRNPSKAGRVRRLFCYVDEADGLRPGMELCVWGATERLRGARNPGGFDYRFYCYAKGIGGIFYANRVEVSEGSRGTLSWRLSQIRSALGRQLDVIASPEDAGILKAVLLGDRGGLDDRIYALYQQNGISHLLAISGLHVSLLGAGLFKLLRRCGVSREEAGAGAGFFLICYGGMTGWSPSVVRAIMMLLISFLADCAGRTYDLPSAMCVPALYLLCHTPYVLTQASFQLSFLAVGAVFCPGGLLIRRFEVKGPGQAFLISVSIQLVTAPVILYHSFEFPPYAVFLNLAVIPLMAYVVVSGLSGLLVSILSPGAGSFFLGAAHVILRFYETLCRILSELPGASLILGRPDGVQIAGFYLCLAAACLLLLQRKGRNVRTACCLGAGCLLGSFFFLIPFPESGLSATFLDVGQGDGIFLEADGYSALVDFGSSQQRDVGEDILIPFLKSRGERFVDDIVVTHGDLDHINGIRYFLEQEKCGISAGRLVLPAYRGGDEALLELARLAKERGIPVVFAGRGDRLCGFEGSRGGIWCLHPSKTYAAQNRNDGSLVTLVQYGRFSMLLTGDVGKEGEEEMLTEGSLGPVTVLKAAHHGSRTSSSDAFLALVRPACAVLSYGEGNRYGHPDREVVERLLETGARIWETAREGAVMIRTDGITMQVSGYRK